MQQYFNLNFYAVSGIINALVSIGFGIFVLSQDRKNAINFSFFLCTIAVVLWSIPYAIWQIVQFSEGEALFWSRALMAGAIFTPSVFFQLTVSFLDLMKRYKKILFVSYAVFSFYLFILIIFPSLFVRSVEPIAGISYFPKPGVLFHGFLTLWFSQFLYSLYLLLRALKKFYGEKRSQLFYILIAIPPAFINGAVNYLPWYNIPVPPITTILVSLYVPIMGYAVLKHHLFNFKIAATKLATLFLFIIVSFNFFLSSNLTSLIIGFFTMIFSGVLGWQINKLVVKEFEQKEQLAILNTNLDNLN